MLFAREYRFTGIVQGVGFRPWIYLTAVRLGLNGTVLNDGEGVSVHVEGTESTLNAFSAACLKSPPPLSRIDSCTWKTVPVKDFKDFRIVPSRQSTVKTGIPSDAAVCPDCLRELFNPADRRFLHPFINCTHCGPRYTITESLPYDRVKTSMKDFAMCPECRKEYENPLDRRFHAQPVCCPQCGPKLSMLDRRGIEIEGDPIRIAASLIRNGKTVAVKGIGGFHLVCDASNDSAVRRLRELKNRPSKPLAVMAVNVDSARLICRVSVASENLLRSAAAPIVLCPKKSPSEVSDAVAPGLNELGVMLPYTPIHWLLFCELLGRPAFENLAAEAHGTFLIMTSANRSGEPLITDNAEALDKLSDIADAFLLHDRDILVRCDDSVLRADPRLQVIRRARGYVPDAIELPFEGECVLALGALLKNTVCLTKGKYAYLSQYIGDLDRAANCLTLKETVRHLENLFDIKPKAIACDLHPDFYSTRFAEETARLKNIPLTRIQHHHAHIAAVMAEHRLFEPVIGLAADGIGLGDKGDALGGEILFVRPDGFKRAATLAPLELPGADKCAREGWRIALALLKRAYREKKFLNRLQSKDAERLNRLLDHMAPSRTSSLGRVFDAAASLLGVAHASSYEGEAAMLLEAAANGKRGRALSRYVSILPSHPDVVDLRALLMSLANRCDIESAAADFHTTVAFILTETLALEADKYGVRKICAAGGCCLNTLLMQQIRERLEAKGLTLYEAERVPGGDGGIALGQAYILLMQQRSKHHVSGCSRSD